MKDKVYKNHKDEGWAYYFMHEYIEAIGYNPTLYDGKSRSKTYSAPNANYQVVCWQTKKNIYCEVVR